MERSGWTDLCNLYFVHSLNYYVLHDFDTFISTLFDKNPLNLVIVTIEKSLCQLFRENKVCNRYTISKLVAGSEQA